MVGTGALATDVGSLRLDAPDAIRWRSPLVTPSKTSAHVSRDLIADLDLVVERTAVSSSEEEDSLTVTVSASWTWSVSWSWTVPVEL